MKKIMKWTLLLLMLLVLLAGCDLFGTLVPQTKDQCLSGFFGAAQSGNWSGMRDYIHPDNPSVNSYNAAFFENAFEDTNVDYSVTTRDGQTFTLTVDYTSGSDTETYVFAPDSDGNQLIATFTVNGNQH